MLQPHPTLHDGQESSRIAGDHVGGQLFFLGGGVEPCWGYRSPNVSRSPSLANVANSSATGGRVKTYSNSSSSSSKNKNKNKNKNNNKMLLVGSFFRFHEFSKSNGVTASWKQTRRQNQNYIETQVAGFLCHIGTGSHGRLRVTETGDIGIKRSVG